MQRLNIIPDPRLEPAPEPAPFDYALSAAKVGALAFPFLGAGAAFIDLLTAPIRGNRINDWYEQFRLRLNDLSQKVEGLTWEKLEKDEAFFSAFAQASQSAIKTHQKEKLEALRNAVLNVALGKQPDPNRQQQFLALVNRVSEAHLVILKFLNDPEGSYKKLGKWPPFVVRGGQKLVVNNVIAEAIPSLRKSSSQEERESTPFEFIELILRDLVSSRLVTLDQLNDTCSVPAFSPRQGGAPRKTWLHIWEKIFSHSSWSLVSKRRRTRDNRNHPFS